MPSLNRSLRWPAVLGTGLACVLLGVGCTDRAAPGWSGYAEGERVYIAAPVAGRLQSLPVRVGDPVSAGQLLFELEGSVERAAQSEAHARSASARAQADNADKGRREPELNVIAAQLEQARGALKLATADLVRQNDLLARGFVARARVEDALTLQAQVRARVAELEAALVVGRLPSRTDERASARALLDAALSSQSQAEWRVRQLQQWAPVEGRIDDVFMQIGEWLSAGQPVLALLPPANRKARFYVPQSEVGSLQPGQTVQLHCDGCPESIAARISHISHRPEYTPPVIYSNAQRAKLVFMVEARPIDPRQAERLNPGQPLEVRR